MSNTERSQSIYCTLVKHGIVEISVLPLYLSLKIEDDSNMSNLSSCLFIYGIIDFVLVYISKYTKIQV